MHRLFPLFIIAYILILNANPSFAQRPSPNQPVEIHGQVRYSQGGSPASEVIVRLDRLSGGSVSEVRTDRLGKFRFSNLSPVQYHITIRHPGFKEILREVNLIMSFTEYVQLQLVPDKPTLAASVNGLSKVISANIPPAARKEYEMGEAAVSSGDKKKIEEGVRHLEKAVSLYPDFVQAQMNLGAAYMDLQQWEKAEQALRKTLEIEPKAFNAAFALGEIYMRQKRTEEAERIVLQGLAVEDRSFQGHLLMGRIYWETALKLKDETQARPGLEKAYEHTKKALALNPNLAEAHLLKGNLFFRARRASDALREFEEYLRLEPNGEFASATRTLVDKIKKALASTKAQTNNP